MRFIEEPGLAANIQTTYSNLVELACSRASEKPDQTAYVFLQDGENESGRLTFADLDRRARAIAARLQSMGMTGERVLLLYPPGLDYIEGFFGCLYAGVVAVPASPPTRRQQSRLLAVINDAAPAVIMTTTDLSVKYRNEFEGMAERNYNGLNLSGEKLSPKGEGRDETKAGTPVWFATDKPEAAVAESWVKPALNSNSLAFLQYTSGSTGDPKGVMVSHGNLMANQEAIKQGFGHTEHTTVVGWLPLYHDMGLIGNLLQPLYLGVTAVLMPPLAFLEKPIRWLKAISTYQANTSGGPNFAYDLCLRKVTAEQMQGLDLTAWTLAFNGSEPVRAATMDRFAEMFVGCGFRRESFFPCYGLAEATLFVSGEKLPSIGYAKQPEEKPQVRSVSCGSTSDHHEIRIADPETGGPCQEDGIGEIWVAGPSIAKGYWNRPEESEPIFRARLANKTGMDRSIIDALSHRQENNSQTFLRTGDLGFLDNGQLYITGRIKDLIIIRGRNFYPQDIEQALTEEIPAFIPDGCVAFSISHEDEEQLIVVAEITRVAMRSGDYEAIASAVRKVLAEVCELAAAELVLVQPGTVPKTSSGKIRRQPCKQLYLENSLPVLFRSGDQTNVKYSPVGEQASLKALEESSPTPSPEYQILQQALLAVPQAQRALLICRFLKHKIARLLKVEESLVSTDSPLRSLGLDSLKAVELKHATDDLLGMDTPLSLFLSDDSLEKIAEKLSEATEFTDGCAVHTDPSAGTEQDAHSPLYNSNLSATQFSMWTMQQLEPNSIVYNLHLALRIAGAIDQERLKQAFHYLTERHTMLRTLYRVGDNDKVIQQVLPTSELPDFFTAVDASAWPESQLQDDMARRAREPFDLAIGPLLRITCYEHGKPGLQNDPLSSRRGTDQSLPTETYSTLLICAHHIAVDLWSVLILVSELKQIYADLSAGLEPQLNALNSNYTDFVAWQRHYLGSPACDKAWNYWHRQLTGELPLLSLPTDSPRPTVSDYRGASVAFRLSLEETERLKKLAGQQGVTLFALLLTAYKVLLHRYTHQKDVIVGVPTSGRSQSRFAPIVGNFVNPLPLRSYPSGNKVFSDYLAEVNDALLTALEYQDFPFSLLVERLQPERVADHWPIYQTLFVLQQAQTGFDTGLAQLALGEDGAPLLWNDQTMQPLSLCQRIERFDLKLMAAECGDGLLLSFQYRNDLFTAETVSRIAAHFHNLLDSVIATPEVRIASLPMIGDKERKKLLYEWNASGHPFSEDSCMYQLFEAQAARTPNVEAVVCNGERLTYGELNVAARVWVHHLITLGVGPGARVGICVERSVNFIIGILAVLKTGAAYVPIDAEFPAERVAHMLGDAGVEVLLTQSGLYKTAKLPVSARLNMDEAQGSAIVPIADKRPRAMPDHCAYVIYTSGSTGQSKGVAISHRSLVNYTQAIAGQIQAEASLQYALMSTPAADLGNTVLFASLVSGGCLHILDHDTTTDGRLLAGYIDRNLIDVLKIVPSHFAALLDSAEGKNIAPRRTLIFGGDVLQNALIARVASLRPECRVFNHYGPTEATIGALIYPVAMKTHGNTSDVSAPIGRPIANSQTYILDENLEPVPIGVPGELYIGGIGVAQGYLNRPDLTAERFIPDPFAGLEPGEDSSILKPQALPGGARLYRTGDLARYRGDGLVEFLGRADHQLKIRGFRIEPGEIEARLCAHPGVSDCIVIAWEDTPGIKRLAAYIVPVNAEPDQEALRIYVRNALPDYMTPSAFVFLKKWPLTANGKLDRKALPKPDPGSCAAHQYVAPRNDAEAALAAIWAEVLRVERVGIHDNFFALGGDSILSIQMASRARQVGLNLSPRQIFQHQIIGDLAASLLEANGDPTDWDDADGAVPLAPVQRRFFAQGFANPHHWNQAVLLEAKQAVDLNHLKAAIYAVVAHHDAFRLRFVQEHGAWKQFYAAMEPGDVDILECVDLSKLTPVPIYPFENCGTEGLSQTLSEQAAYWQTRLNISQGPLLRAVWFDGDEQHRGYLLLVIHHLIVDAVSWNILMDDLYAAYQMRQQGKIIALPNKTASYKRWALRLEQHAQAERSAAADLPEQTYPSVSLPVDNPAGSNSEHLAHTIHKRLSAEHTAQLSHACQAYHAQIQELLLAALTQVVSRWAGTEQLWVEIEGHGRDIDLGTEEADVTRTLGWFTTHTPVRFCLSPVNVLDGLVKSVKEQLRRQLGRQLDQVAVDVSESAPLLFNYLGRIGLSGAISSVFQLAKLAKNTWRDLRNRRGNEWEIIAFIADDCLHLEWTYSTARYAHTTIECLANHIMTCLEQLIQHGHDADIAVLTPLDFPLTALTQTELDSLPYPPHTIEDIYPLTPMQEGMLFHTLMEPDSGIYLMQNRFEIQGLLDKQAFRQAWQAIVDRHAALRTCFIWDIAGGPYQIVHNQVTLPFEYLDWQGYANAEQEALMDELFEAELKQGFDLTRAPLFRVRLIRLGDDRYWVTRVYHHILIDAWCTSLILMELKSRYQALVRGEELSESQTYPFRNYISWLRHQDLRAAENFWRNYLQGFIEPTPIPVGRADGTHEYKDKSVDDVVMFLSEPNTQKLNRVAQQYRLTPNTFLQAAWALLLRGYSDRDEVLFGVTVAGRPTELPGSDKTLGVFINTLPLRVRLQAHTTLPELLKDLLRQNLEMRQYEYLHLIQIQACSEVPRERELFDSIFVFENYPVDPALHSEDDGLHLTDMRTRTHTNYPITGMVIPGERLHLQITYQKKRFETAVVERMLGHFRNLLEAMIDAPDKRISEIFMLTEKERRLTLYQWNRTAHSYPHPRDVVTKFELEVEHKPDAIAVACLGKQLTYRELNNRANRVAHALLAEGVGPETLIALFNDRGIDYLVMLLGVFKAGGAYLPFDPSHPDVRIAQVLKESGVGLILTGASYFERVLALAGMVGDSLATGGELPKVGALGGAWRAATEQTPTRACASLSVQLLCPSDVLILEELESYENEVENPLGCHTPDNLAVVIFTSGSTGMPKGAMVEHRGMFNNLITKVPRLGLTEKDVIAQTAGQCFDISVWQHLTALACGARVEIFADEIAKDPSLLLAQLAEHGVTVLEAVPSMIQALLESADDEFELPKLRWVIASGEAFPPALCRRWMEWLPHVKVLNAYGPAECSDDVSYYEVPAIPAESETFVPIGQPVHNTRLYILDRWLEPVPVGVAGEIYVAGIQVGRGYLNRPDLTAENFIPDPFDNKGTRLYRTSDLGRYREDGAIEFLSRADHQVKIRGVRIEPGEIEAQLLTAPEVDQALVTVREDATGDKRLVAYVVCSEIETGSDAGLVGRLRDYLSDRLPNAMMPSAFVRLKAMPLGANGKIDRKALPEPDMARQSDLAYLAPRNPAEEALVDIWKEVLDIERVGVADNFFELGGHSLLAVQVLSRIRRAFGIEVPLRKLFDASTIEALALLVEALLIEQLDSLSEEEAEALLIEDEEGVSMVLKQQRAG